MDTEKDLLQIKIDKAKAQLSDSTLEAIESVDWHSAILGLREKKAYTLEQLSELETETELLLCGLVSPDEYPKELEKRMGLPKIAINELVNEMNTLVFSKIKEEMMKRITPTEQKTEIGIGAKNETEQKEDSQVLDNAGIKIVKENPIELKESESVKPKEDETVMKSSGVEILEGTGGSPLKNNVPPEKEQDLITSEKLAGFSKTKVAITEHSLKNISRGDSLQAGSSPDTKTGYAVDPYREIPE